MRSRGTPCRRHPPEGNAGKCGDGKCGQEMRGQTGRSLIPNFLAGGPPFVL
jgi:hypothetical protein